MNLPPWQAELWQQLAERHRRGTLAHALLLCGAPGAGKRAFADAFARARLCQKPREDASACGSCRACLLLAAGSHPDLVRVGLELRDDGKPRSEITVDQIRALSERLTLTAQFGGYQIALIDPADAMNVNASNALLKTLEEPTRDTLIVLLSDQPSRLSATIRSRCQRLDFRLPPPEVALRWLAENGFTGAAASTALAASGGNPGLALAWSRAGALALREEVAADLSALLQGRRGALELANRWGKEGAESRLWFAATLVQQQAQACACGEAGPFALTCDADLTKLAAWFDQANRARDTLRGPLRPELILVELLTAFAALAPRRRTA